jgi:hypothetical protein
MSRYKIMVNILDRITKEAPSKYKIYYPTIDDINGINLARSKAFIHLFMKVKFGLLDFETREQYISDSTGDGGIDGYYIDDTSKKIYLVQSKFRITSENFEDREITIKELLKMEISRIVKDGETTSELGIPYNSKILKLIESIKHIPDIANYEYLVIVIANIKKITPEQLVKITGGYKTEIFDFQRSYNELVFPVVSGTYFKEKDLYIYLNVDEKTAGGRMKYVVDTEVMQCKVTVVFVPTIEIAQAFSKYKNTILRFNPRSFLELSNNPVNREIEKTILQKKTNEFALYNNGITMISDKVDYNDSTGQKNRAQIKITNPQVINGGQTGFTLSRILESKLNDNPEQWFNGKEVLVKIITFSEPDSTTSDDTPSKLQLIESISKATNQQTKITEADRRSNDKIQVDLQREIYQRFGYFYERKRGEFADGIRFNYIDRSQIIDREIFLRICIACNGLPSQARRSSDDTIFGKDYYYNKLCKLDELNKCFWGYIGYIKLNEIQRTFDSQPHNRFGFIQYGNALRYGKFAIIAASIKAYSDTVPINQYETEVDKSLKKHLSTWKKFEQYVVGRPKNERYFKTEYDQETETIKSELNFDNYYKGKTLNSDLVNYFSSNQ